MCLVIVKNNTWVADIVLHVLFFLRNDEVQDGRNMRQLLCKK